MTRTSTRRLLSAAPPDGIRPHDLMRPGRSDDVGSAGWRCLLVCTAVLAVVSVFMSASSAQWTAAAGGVLTVLAAAYGLALHWENQGFSAALHHPMTLISAGLGFIVTGEVLHAADASFPSSADVVSLAAYPLLLVGLLRLSRARLREHPLDTLLVAAIVPISLAAFGWLPLLSALNEWQPDRGRPAWSSLAFVIVDGLAVAIIGRLVLLFRGKPVGYQLLLGAFAALLGAHLSRAAASVTRVVPAPFGSQTLLLIGFGLAGAATLHPSLRQHRRALARPAPIGSGYLLMMTTMVLVGPAVAIKQYAHIGGWVVVAIAGPALVALLVVAHLSRLLTERSRLEHASTHDALTGLANRTLFHEKVAVAVTDAEGDAPFAVGFLDLDRFKKVNDSLGHDAGDELLCQVAERLCVATRDEDVVARLAGDEFALLLPGAGEAEANGFAQRIVATFDNPFRIAGRSLVISPSVGLAVHPQHGAQAETLLRHADAAMYHAKTIGRNTVVTYHAGLGVPGQQHVAVETALHTAISGDELVVHYQPKVNAATGEITGVEALVRWRHPQLGMIPPSAFIGLAEQTALIAKLGDWVLTNACCQAQAWRAAGQEIPISVNLSARQFELQDVPEIVTRALASSGLPAHLLELEITETVSLDALDTIATTLDNLRTLGVHCSIDDFGTGYSGLGYLQRYPAEAIKLDQSLVAAIDQGDAPLVRAAIAMAHSLGLKVIAEGVETPEQAAFLHAHGCDELQGYLISPPLPAEELSRLPVGAELSQIISSVTNATRPMPAQPATYTTWTEEALGRSLLDLQAVADRCPATYGDEDGDTASATHGRRITRTLVLTAAATGLFAGPVLLGLGASDALPPNAQHVITAALDQLHATGAQPAKGQHPEPTAPPAGAPSRDHRPVQPGATPRPSPGHRKSHVPPRPTESHRSPRPNKPSAPPQSTDSHRPPPPTTSHTSPNPTKPHPNPDPTKPHPNPDPTKPHPSPDPTTPHQSPDPTTPHPAPDPTKPHPTPAPSTPPADPNPSHPSHA